MIKTIKSPKIACNIFNLWEELKIQRKMQRQFIVWTLESWLAWSWLYECRSVVSTLICCITDAIEGKKTGQVRLIKPIQFIDFIVILKSFPNFGYHFSCNTENNLLLKIFLLFFSGWWIRKKSINNLFSFPSSKTCNKIIFNFLTVISSIEYRWNNFVCFEKNKKSRKFKKSWNMINGTYL